MKRFLFLLLIFTVQLSFAQVYNDFVGAGHDQDVKVMSSDPQSGAEKSIDGTGWPTMNFSVIFKPNKSINLFYLIGSFANKIVLQ